MVASSQEIECLHVTLAAVCGLHEIDATRSGGSRCARAAGAVVARTAAGKTITAVMHSDLRVLDPVITTAYIVRDHGYMVYDTLLATDANFKVQPQMAE